MRRISRPGGIIGTAAFESLVADLHAVCDEQPWSTTWYVEDLDTGLRADRDGDREVPSASTRKVAILMTALTQAGEGRIDLDEPMVIDERFRDEIYSGCLQHLRPGVSLTFEDALTLMIIVSDNLCTARIVERVGLDAVNDLCRSLGMTSTRHRNAILGALPPDHPLDATNSTSANDMGLLYRSILAGAGAGAGAGDREAATRIGGQDACQRALRILKGQIYREGIPSMLAPQTEVANKTGLGWRDASDGGIVYRDGEPRFILTTYADRVPLELPDGRAGYGLARRLFGDLGWACWHALT